MKLILNYSRSPLNKSHSARSAWIETPDYYEEAGRYACRTPQGVRGLKLSLVLFAETVSESHSARSAWIETTFLNPQNNHAARRTPQGVRGLKLDRKDGAIKYTAVALRKECVD